MVSFTPVEPMHPLAETFLIFSAVFEFLTILVVGLRLASRIVTGSKLGWDDWLMIAAVPPAIGLLVCQGLCRLPIAS